jgi:hypothetical protein
MQLLKVSRLRAPATGQSTTSTASPVEGDTSLDAFRLSSVKTPAAEDSDTGRGSSGRGCDAGFGLFGLLAATGAVALLRRKG